MRLIKGTIDYLLFTLNEYESPFTFGGPGTCKDSTQMPCVICIKYICIAALFEIYELTGGLRRDSASLLQQTRALSLVASRQLNKTMTRT